MKEGREWGRSASSTVADAPGQATSQPSACESHSNFMQLSREHMVHAYCIASHIWMRMLHDECGAETVGTMRRGWLCSQFVTCARLLYSCH